MYQPQRNNGAPVDDWVFAELLRISAALQGMVTPMILLAPQAVAPTKPREGMVVNANGTDWNPGSGAGLYQYLGGAWVQL